MTRGWLKLTLLVAAASVLVPTQNPAAPPASAPGGTVAPNPAPGSPAAAAPAAPAGSAAAAGPAGSAGAASSAGSAGAAGSAGPAVDAAWAPLQFLIGKWSGTGSGKPGELMVGALSFTPDLDRNIVLRRNWAQLAPRVGERKGVVHEDLMIIYKPAGSQALRAIYFDNEGHLINYAVSFPPIRTAAVFESDPLDKGTRYRLSYDLTSDGSLSIEFAVSEAGGEYKAYTRGKVTKARG